jgi:hypothetical protein
MEHVNDIYNKPAQSNELKASRWIFTLSLYSYKSCFRFSGKDVIGLAETGSGKTGAFALPILQALLENPQRYFALILTPTRELAFQTSEQFEALGKIHIYSIMFAVLFFVPITLKKKISIYAMYVHIYTHTHTQETPFLYVCELWSIMLSGKQRNEYSISIFSRP